MEMQSNFAAELRRGNSVADSSASGAVPKSPAPPVALPRRSYTKEYKCEVFRRWRLENPEAYKEAQRKYAQSELGKESAKRRNQRYHERHLEEHREYNRMNYYRKRYGDCHEGYVPLKNIADDIFEREFWSTTLQRRMKRLLKEQCKAARASA